MVLRKAHIVSITVLAYILFFIPPSLASDLSEHKGYAPGEVLIQYRAETSGDLIRKLNNHVGTHATRISYSRQLFRLRLPTEMTVQQAIDFYNENSSVDSAEPNYIIHISQMAPNDPSYPLLWGLCNTGQMGGIPSADVDAQGAWDISTGLHTIIVAVPDTGIDYNHDDLKLNIWTNPGEIPENQIDDDGNGYVDDIRGWNFAYDSPDPFDDHGHGTHVAGIIGAAGNNEIGVVGINWHVSIMPLKFMDADGCGLLSDAIEAIEYAVQLGASVVNMSWGIGSSHSQFLRDAIEDAANDGVIFVASAGNQGRNNDVVPHYPSSYDLSNIISVASTNQNDALAYLSNFGANSVDLGAPGYYIFSTAPGNSYQYKSGTSMATAHVSGVAGLLLSSDPTLTDTQVKDFLLDSTQPTLSLCGKTVTGGRLDAYNCLSGTFPERLSGPCQATGGSDGGGGGCFIATAAFGSSLEKKVKLLCEFRDRYLLKNGLGRKCVALYYLFSPPLADTISQYDGLRGIIKIGLYPLILISTFLSSASPIEKAVMWIITLVLCAVGVGSIMRTPFNCLPYYRHPSQNGKHSSNHYLWRSLPKKRP
jgi:hypothetical protein